jgi:anthranilate/para-aminobenzoate synthase component II
MLRTRSIRFGILDCEDSEKWRGYTESLWRHALGVQFEDTVEVFQCFDSKWPDPANVDEKFDALVIGGSHYSAYEDLKWIHSLEEVLRSYVRTSKIRIIACCFGHQLMAKALGGEIGR